MRSVRDCMDCNAKRVPGQWVMDPLFWFRCDPCQAARDAWEARS